MRSTVKDLLFALLNGRIGELYPKEKIIPRPSTDRLLLSIPKIIRDGSRIMVLDIGDEISDPNPARRDGYTEATYEKALEDGLIAKVDCKGRYYPHVLLTRSGYDKAIEIWGKPKRTIFIFEGTLPVEGGKSWQTVDILTPITPNGSEFDIQSLPRRLTSDEVEQLGYPRPAHEDLHYWVSNEGADWVDISQPRWMELIRKVDAINSEGIAAAETPTG